MKNLALSIILTFQLSTFLNAQSNFESKNQFSATAEMVDGITQIIWETNQEVNTSYFVVERSFDGLNFETIHTTKAMGSTYRTTTYSFEDVENPNATASYRVHLNTMDGENISQSISSNYNSDMANNK